ncbi:ATP-binding cassette domain-containing protein [Halomonas sp. CS7]|uniref:ATP-binding cassette domain-containing protein n=1 Tax=Halomonas pelophila TaxID=3151122 RepID=A0ABV1N494_9GAMM
MTTVIHADGVGRRFAGRRVVADIDLEVRDGEIFGLLGPDGAGKTTLMQMMTAILEPSEGQLRVFGFDTRRDAAQVNGRVGYMTQGFSLYDRLSVIENLQFAARIRDVTPGDFRLRSQELLAMAGLGDFRHRRAGQLSGGMRKKLSLCAALIHAPTLLLLDELSLGVDPLSRRDLWRLLRRHRDDGNTVVISTPYMDEAERCDRLGFLYEGRLLAVDTPDRLRRRVAGPIYQLTTPRLDEAEGFVRSWPGVTSLQRLADRLRIQFSPGHDVPETAQARLDELGQLMAVEPNLEEAFIALSPLAAPADMPPMMPPAFTTTGVEVRAEHLGLRFGDVVAVDEVSFRVPPCEVVGWLGPNGAGKTSLIRLLCGLQTPSAGRAWIGDLSVTESHRDLRGRLGYMSQHFSLYPDLSVAENLTFFAGVYGLAGRQRRLAIDWASHMTRLSGLEERRVCTLSAAVRQRLALACSILHGPAVLFLDEPTSGIDPLSRQRFWHLILALAEHGMTVFVTTHYLEEANYCHRLGLMHQGRLIALDTPAQLRLTLDLPNDADMEAVFMAGIEREQRRPA